MLQPLPQTVTRLVELVESEAATLEQIEALINADPVLCGKVLQVANSAYYGLARQVNSVRHALLLLGAYTIRGIALSVAVTAALRSGRTVDERERRLWRHAFACAGYAQGIAQARRWGVRTAEDAYVAGLLHDIGMLFLLTRFPERYAPLLREAEENSDRLLERELRQFGYDHADVGAMIADYWRLPQRIVQAIASHHAPCLPEGEARRLTAAVALATQWSEAGFCAPPEALTAFIEISNETAEQIRQRVET
ncbi:MAG: HDOD domain-containing protein, partial [Fimbriimonadales bacterium]|nr:HDOD domain-containing protein [Fimbriimonadales bacterium]